MGKTYRDAGVDIKKKAAFVGSIYERMRATFDERVIENRDGYGGLFSLDYDHKLFRRNYRHPVLVSSTDGVGTKLKVAFVTGRHDTVGIDLVAMCANDILVQGAEPLFFLDYLASSKIEPGVLRAVLEGIAAGCEQAQCSLIGGETPELPGFYHAEEYDLAGFVVGVVEKHKLIDGRKVSPGDVVIGVPSSGLHSNGYSLVRKVLLEDAGLGVDDSLEQWGIGRTVGEELLEPTRIYIRSVVPVLKHYRRKQIVHAIAHITGGGLPGNVPRVLPEGCQVVLHRERWEVPRIFKVVQELGEVSDEEMFNVFNMGLGLVLVVPTYFVDSVLRQLEAGGERPVVVGEVVSGERRVAIV
jgi:phosphoribosylformylglycinamidine cyclo-ligase